MGRGDCSQADQRLQGPLVDRACFNAGAVWHTGSAGPTERALESVRLSLEHQLTKALRLVEIELFADR
jgi:hypothetical protein